MAEKEELNCESEKGSNKRTRFIQKDKVCRTSLSKLSVEYLDEIAKKLHMTRRQATDICVATCYYHFVNDPLFLLENRPSKVDDKLDLILDKLDQIYDEI